MNFRVIAAVVAVPAAIVVGDEVVYVLLGTGLLPMMTLETLAARAILAHASVILAARFWLEAILREAEAEAHESEEEEEEEEAGVRLW
jgi:hypothetical protein